MIGVSLVFGSCILFISNGIGLIRAYDQCNSSLFVDNDSGFMGCNRMNKSSIQQFAYKPNVSLNNNNISVLMQVINENLIRQEAETNLHSLTVQNLIYAIPPMALVNSTNVLCKKHSQIYLEELEKLTMWALKMYDSSAKVPSGILNGNINQFGDFDQCLNANDQSSGIQGQYCLAYVEMDAAGDNEKIKNIIKLMHSHSAFRSRLEDPGHRVPRFSTINWAICTPASCSPSDIEQEIHTLLSKYVNTNEIRFRLKVDPNMCQTLRKSYVPTTGSLIAVLTFGALFATIALSTVLDLLSTRLQESKSSLSKFIYSFSLKRNILQFINLNESPDSIKSIHSIRAINAFMLLASHKSMAMFFNPYSNRTQMAEKLGKRWTVLARAASLYTDPFIFMSGILTCTTFLRHLERKGKINIPNEYLSRYVRLVPTMGAIILFCTMILPNLGSGPQWNLVVKQHADICEKYWWRNFLFIHNLFGFKNVCLSHTHHIGIDSQLFALSPLLVWTLWKWPKKSLVAMIGLAAFSTGLRYYATMTKKLNLFINYSSSVSTMYDTADFSYVLPTHRLTVYIMGILLGYLLKCVGPNYKMKSINIKLGWIIAIGFFYQAYIAPSKMGDMNYVYNVIDAANYAAFAPICWCIFFGWIIFISHTGNGGLVSEVFSWKGFIILTRFSYTFYLTQFPVFFYNVGSNRAPLEYSFGLMCDIHEFLVTIFVSIALTVAVEMPFNNIKTAFIRKS
ncbi:nose resistant to fluoxetine protein 6-like [Daktulosphaira vitifoliae]|uniref:nose resistant to fluoxetine protein 6-like n=1 Tax=Daktulosphaira vitifoliae TaxID=58002 RepID=UPI0021AA1884|nr:nose resistant to fluoxetine protein 6-like [Daktulosphaira vitifoliae]